MGKLFHVNALAAAVGIVFASGVSQPSFAVQSSPQLEATASQAGEATDGSYIVTFEEPGLLHYTGGVQGLSATAPKALGSRKLDAQSSASRAYESYLDAQRAAHVTEIENRIGRPLDVTHTYGVIRNGIAAKMSPEEAAKIASAPGVVSVRPVKIYTPDTFRGPKFIGANTIWDGSNVPGGVGNRGEGIKVGVIDTGTNSAHPSFANDETCGFSTSNPKLHAFDCNQSASGHCTGTNPEAPSGAGDVLSHGVHTSSTAVGNTIDNTATPPPSLPNGVTMSGVAPCATLYSYKVADATGGLPDSAINAAVEAIVTDGVDVANFSIGPTCGGGSPWADTDRDFLDAINADVFVAASAGNTRTACTNPVGRVSHTGPWMLTVAASTQDQTLGQAALTVTGPGTVPPLLSNIGVTKGSTVDMAQVNDLLNKSLRVYPQNITGCTDTGGIPANYFNGAIAVIRRGAIPPSTTACSFTEKINNAKNAGASLVVIANNKNDAQGMDTSNALLPGFKINDLATSDALIAFVTANNGSAPNADVIFADGFDGTTPQGGAAGNFVKGDSLVTVQGDVLGNFSFRGPTSGGVADLTKPDITGPGVSIYAAARASDASYILMSGTSMSSPHLAGAAALIRKAHPDWTVTEVKSALMTTSLQTGFQEDGTTAWTVDQVGSGRVDLTKAAKAGLTLDETYANFVAANPTGGTINVKDLNLPSLRNVNCTGSCTWKRTVKNRLGTSGTWNATVSVPSNFGVTVSPATFTLAPGQTQELTITATPTASMTAIGFGNVNLKEANGASPDQHLTIALKGSNGPAAPAISVSPTSLSSTLAPNATDTKTLNIANTGGGSLTWSISSGSVPGTIWDQPKGGTSGIVSDFSTTSNKGAYTAADFQVSAGSTIRKIKAYGFDNSGTLSSQSKITWRIYGDAGGVPNGNPDTNTGTPVWSFETAPNGAGVTIGTGGTGQDITLDLAAAGQNLNLPAGTYWLTVFPTYSGTITGQTDPRWNWFQAASQKGNPDMLVSSLFGAANWTTLQSLVQWPDVAFTIEGDVTCGAPWLSLTPASGSTAGGATTPVTATFNSNGMTAGSYAATACVASNDTAKPMVAVPVTMTVQSGGGGNTCPSQILLDPGFEASSGSTPTITNPNWASTSSNAGASGSSLCDDTCAETPGQSLARNGVYFVWFGGWGTVTETGTASQQLVIPSGQSRFLNYWLRREAGTATTSQMTVSIDGTVISTIDRGTGNETAYVPYSLAVPAQYADGGNHKIEFKFSKTGTGQMANFFLDDVTLDCTAQPTSSQNVDSTNGLPLLRKLH